MYLYKSKFNVKLLVISYYTSIWIDHSSLKAIGNILLKTRYKTNKNFVLLITISTVSIRHMKKTYSKKTMSAGQCVPEKLFTTQRFFSANFWPMIKGVSVSNSDTTVGQTRTVV